MFHGGAHHNTHLQNLPGSDNPKSWYPRIDFEEAGEETSKKTEILLKDMVLIVLPKY